MKTSNRFTVDLEIPRLFLSIDITAENWGEALAKASQVRPLQYVKFKTGSHLLDSENPKIMGILKQDK